MKKISCFTLVTISAILSSGCASITKDANQPVQIETYSKNNQIVNGAKCMAKNERGEWSAITTGVVNVHRSNQNLLVTCDKDGEETGRGTLISRANGGMFGNILFGGGIGAIVDHNTGKAYSYPDWIRVIMGDNLVFDRKLNKDNQVMVGVTSTEENTKKAPEPIIESTK